MDRREFQLIEGASKKFWAIKLNGKKVDRTRPLCRYPQVARYKGTGSTDEAASFSCQAL